MTFDPQVVDKNSWKMWVVDGLTLMSRRPVQFIIIALIFLLITFIPGKYTFAILLGLTPLFMGFGVLAAEATDLNVRLIDLYKSKLARTWLRLIMVGMVLCLLLSGAIFIYDVVEALKKSLNMLPEYSSTGNKSRNPLFKSTGMLLLCVYIILINYLTWFLIPLVVVKELSLNYTFSQSLKAIKKNKFIAWRLIFLSIAIFLIALCALFGSMVAVVFFYFLYALICCTMYTSYQHLWFNTNISLPIQTDNLWTRWILKIFKRNRKKHWKNSIVYE